MIYRVEQITKDVRVCMDENRVTEALLGVADTETLKLDEVIASKIVEAVRRVHSAAPYHLLEQGHNLPDTVYWGDQESGWVLLPDDFMRLVVFEMSDWERPVYSAITPDSPEYARQRSRFKALRGVAQRPVVALCVRPEGRVLEFYSCKSEDATVRKGVYMPEPVIDENGGVDISERCYDAVVYTVAGLTAMTCGEGEKAKELLALATGLMESNGGYESN